MSQSNGREHYVNLTPGKLMGLRQITDANGRFKVLALDQTGVFRDAFGRDKGAICAAKLALTSVIGAHASSTLLDVPTSARQSINTGDLPKGVGLVVRLEKGCSAGDYGFEETGWDVAKIKRMGGSAVKLLVYMDTDNEKYTNAQVEYVKRTCDACHENDILLMTEELSFPRKDADEPDNKAPKYLERRVRNILKSTELIGPWTDVLKLEFPGEDHLKELNDIAIRPWVLLSAGVNFDVFEKQVEATMQAGASGIMAGRAIFKEWLDKSSEHFQSQAFLAGEAVRRFQKLNTLVDAHADSWQQRYNITRDDLAGAVDYNWYSWQAAEVPSAPGVY